MLASVTRAQERGRELARQKEQLRVTLASIGDAVVCTDGTGHIDFINPAAEQLTGWTLGEARGRPLQSIAPLLNEDTHRPVNNPVEIVLRSGETMALANHTVLVSRLGGEVPIEDSAAPIRTEGGDITGVVLVFHDVTAKRRSEAALRERERLLAAVASGAAVGLAIIRKNGEYAFANDACARAFGLSEQEIVGRDASAVADRAWDKIRPLLERAFAGQPANHEIFLEPGGRPGRCYAVSYEPQGCENERGVVVVMLDITERKRAEHQLQVSEERHRLAVDAGELGTWDYYPLSNHLIWDTRCRQLLGLDQEGPAEFSLFVASIHSDDRDRVLQAINAALQPGSEGHYDIEYRVVRPRDRAERWVHTTGRTYFDPGASGRACRFIGTVQDITEEKRREDALHFMVDLSAATQSLVEPEEILRTIARMLRDHLGVDRCAYAEVENESTFVRASWAAAPSSALVRNAGVPCGPTSLSSSSTPTPTPASGRTTCPPTARPTSARSSACLCTKRASSPRR
jgi:PAS domain S-box-containing protein